MRLLSTVDRWGPGLVAVITLFALCGMGWIYSSQIARLEGRVETLQRELDRRVQLEIALRSEVQTWQAYTVKLQTSLIDHRVENVPQPPDHTDKEK